MKKPRMLYFVTQDLHFLMQAWCKDRKPALIPPPARFFRKLSSVLREGLRGDAFAEPVDGSAVDVQFLSGDKFPHLKKTTKRAFWITLDDVYVKGADFTIAANRVFDEDGEFLDVTERAEALPIETQVHRCREKYLLCNSPREVVLADDGTYTGESVVRVMKWLEEVGIFVTEIRLAFCTVESFHKIGRFTMESKKPNPVKYWPGIVIDHQLDLLDWVCERDFFVGVPRSGRSCGTRETAGKVKPVSPAIGRPYVLPWGDIKSGATITKGSQRLSMHLTDASIRLWSEIERINRVRFKVQDLPRFPGPGPSRESYEANKDLFLIDFLERIEADYFPRAREIRNKTKWTKTRN